MNRRRNTPTREEFIESLFHELMDDRHVCMPGRIESFDSGNDTANVKPMLFRTFINEENERESQAYPVIPCVPVAFGGGSGAKIEFPLSKGDLVLLVFSDHSIDKWIADQKEGDPNDDRRNHLSDAFAIPFAKNGVYLTEPTFKADTYGPAFDLVIQSIATALNGISPGAGAPVLTALTTFNNTPNRTTKTKIS